MNTGIYCIENLINGKKYIGQSTNLKDRMFGCHKCCHAIINAIEKYGENNFKRYIILYCEEWELERLEKECIKIFHSHFSENGYNISFGGKAFMRGRNLSPEHIKKISGKNNHGFGKPRSDEIRKKISESQKGEKGNNFGKKIPENVKKKISKALTGRLFSKETCKKLSENHANFNGINNPKFGKKESNASSKYHGIILRKGKNNPYWTSRIYLNKKNIFIGNYKNETDAALAYDKYILEHNLPNPLNFPK